jgi:hypothetical protein
MRCNCHILLRLKEKLDFFFFFSLIGGNKENRKYNGYNIYIEKREEFTYRDRRIVFGRDKSCMDIAIKRYC